MLRNPPQFLIEHLRLVYVLDEVVACDKLERLILKGELVAAAEYKRFAVGDVLVHASVWDRFGIEVA
jgi:hypothetical protein